MSDFLNEGLQITSLLPTSLWFRIDNTFHPNLSFVVLLFKMNMEVSYISSPEFYSLALYILGSISLPIHLFGAYCILCQTPDTMKRVKWVMFNLHAWSCSLDILLGLFDEVVHKEWVKLDPKNRGAIEVGLK